MTNPYILTLIFVSTEKNDEYYYTDYDENLTEANGDYYYDYEEGAGGGAGAGEGESKELGQIWSWSQSYQTFFFHFSVFSLVISK